MVHKPHTLWWVKKVNMAQYCHTDMNVQILISVELNWRSNIEGSVSKKLGKKVVNS